MHDHDDELEHLAQSRVEADRLYNAALTALDAAIVARPELPRPTVGFDDRQIQPLNESWRLLPDETIDLGTGWRRRLRGMVWRLIEPFLQRQQRFNGLLVEHLNRNVQVAGENPASVAACIAALDRHLGALADFQGQLIRYLQQITLYVDTRDRHVDGRARRETAQVRGLVYSLDTALNAVADEFRKRLESAEIRDFRAAEELKGLRQSVELATAATHAMKRRVERLREAPTATADPPGPGRPRPARADLTDLEAYKYLCFEDAFRGPREQISVRQRDYLAYFEGASDVLDVGCGRGEFLALLRERGVTARGLDTNAEVVERCREQDLDAIQGDALDYLGGLADESLGGLFSAQVVEHLEAEYLTRMLAEAQRVLRPGSRIVLETINPASWTAFFSAFIRDITHRHPLHPDTLGYFLRASGFVDVEIVYRAPVPDGAQLQRAAVDATLANTPAGAAVCALAETFNRHVDRLNGLIFAEQDYAAIARRP